MDFLCRGSYAICHILWQADADKDGHLSLKEMLDHPYVFYSAIFTDEDDEDYYHEEFR